MAYAYIFQEVNTLLPMAIIAVLLIIGLPLLYVFRRKVVYELQLNLKKQKKCIEMLNKKNVVYVYYTNFLRFCYNKYKVRNTNMLRNNLNDYTSYKHITSRIDTVRSIMYETESGIEKFMKEKKLTDTRISVDEFTKVINVEDKKRFYNDTSVEKARVEQELNNLDARHEEIWNALMFLNDGDKSHERLIDSLMQAYLGEMNRIMDEYAKKGDAETA
jgi:hypothetical protein